MSAGKFKPGAPSANPAGRPSREDALWRDFDGVFRDFGLEQYEREGLVNVLLLGKPAPLFVALELIARRLDAELLRSRAEPTGDEEASADDSFF